MLLRISLGKVYRDGGSSSLRDLRYARQVMVRDLSASQATVGALPLYYGIDTERL